MGYQHRLVLAMFIAVIVVSCKKEEDARPPVVTIVAPGNGFDLSVPDTLHVAADVSGEEDVDQLSFTIANVNGVPLLEPLIVVPASNPARVEVDIPITSDLVASGDYTLTVQASSGDAHGKDQIELDIIGTPLRLRRLLVIGQPDASTVTIHIIDSTGAVSLANTLLMDLAGAAVSSAAQTFAVAGSVDGPVTAFKPDGVLVRWQKPNLGNSSIPWFTSLDLGDDGRYHVGTTDGSLYGYNAGTGAVERVYDLLPNCRAKTTANVDDHLLIAQVDQPGTSWRMGTYQASSGALVNDQLLEQSVMAMWRRNDANALLFGDQDGHGVVKDHNIEAGGGWEPYSWTSSITAAERVDANTFLVALSDGAVERFTYSNAGSIAIAAVPDVHDLSLDPVSGLVYAATGTEVVAINPVNGQVAASYTIGVPVRYVLPLLNR